MEWIRILKQLSSRRNLPCCSLQNNLQFQKLSFSAIKKVANVLHRFDRKGLHVKVLPFHAALAEDIRLANMKKFLNSKAKDSMFLIFTERASRDIDFPNVDRVVLFDFPRYPSEYARHIGRTARGAGGTGKAFVFVVGKQASLARRTMERNKKGHPLHDVPSAYELESSVL